MHVIWLYFTYFSFLKENFSEITTEMVDKMGIKFCSTLTNQIFSLTKWYNDTPIQLL